MRQPQRKGYERGARWNYFTSLFFVTAVLSLTLPPVVHLQNQSRGTEQGGDAVLETATDFSPRSRSRWSNRGSGSSRRA